MAIVRTVTGDVDADELGPTTMHEHIFGDFTVWQEDPMDAERASAVATLVNEGHLDQILLGQDVWLKNCYKHYGGLGYDHLFTGVKALLTQAGVTHAQFQQLLVDNPRRALALATS
jgi:predicted metal-dependent phosphotriesterase family hydrolase